MSAGATHEPARAVAPPLSALLSQALVAFLIECDNEAEQRLPHRTTDSGGARGPWLTSIVMWFNCMRFLDAGGTSVAELERRSLTSTNLAGMTRWGFVRVERAAGAPPRDSIVRASAAGRRAAGTWSALPGEIEERWRARRGSRALDVLRDALVEVLAVIGRPLPECLPILGHGLRTTLPAPAGGGEHPAGPAAQRSLPALLSQALLVLALPFERRAPVSLAISANVLRLLDGDDPVRVSELPRRSGVSIESLRMAVGWLERGGFATLEPLGGGRARGRAVALTDAGRDARRAYATLTESIERGLGERVGATAVERLRASLDALCGEPGARSPLLDGLEPPAGSWRAGRRRPDVLPHYPMVLHRGGYPDGS